MYLVLKSCIEANHLSCGCRDDYKFPSKTDLVNQRLKNHPTTFYDDEQSKSEDVFSNQINISEGKISAYELKKLDTGSPVRLSKSITKVQGKIMLSILAKRIFKHFIDEHLPSLQTSFIGCAANVAFASAFTRLFIDSDDSRTLNRVNKILNENTTESGFRADDKRLLDFDHKELSFIRWTKAAINIHNNHVGRQVGSQLFTILHNDSQDINLLLTINRL